MSFRTAPLAALRRRCGGKWRQFGPQVIPCFVADMDFPLAPPLHRCLAEALELDDFGYPLKADAADFARAFAERMAARFDWHPDPGLVGIITDVVQGLYIAVDRFTAPGDGVVVQTPIYPPFLGSVLESGREVIRNRLINNQSGWQVDVDSLARAITPRTRLLALCNPHNPSGRVLRRSELERLAALALEHDLLVVADEIHADLVYPGARHVPFASLSPEVAARTVTFNSPSKAFNTAGLRIAAVHFGTPALKARFDSLLPRLRGGLVAHAARIGCIAWRECDDWLAEAMAYLEGNRELLARFVAERLPGVRFHRPEATYLAWLDFRGCAIDEDPQSFLLREARVALSPGPAFGDPEGVDGARLNFATDRAVLETILERMADALDRR